MVGLILCVTLTRIQLPHWEDSAQLFKRVIEVDPKTVTGYLNLSGELNTHERYQESAQYLEKALTIGPTAGIYLNLAVWLIYKPHIASKNLCKTKQIPDYMHYILHY